MTDRIKDKTTEIEGYIDELSVILPHNLNEYLDNLEKKAACERYFEKIIEAVVDLAFLIVKEKRLRIPREDKEAFDILSREKIISQELAEKLKDAKGMRNVIAHEYGQIDDNLVFHSITEDLEEDIRYFINVIRNALK